MIGGTKERPEQDQPSKPPTVPWDDPIT